MQQTNENDIKSAMLRKTKTLSREPKGSLPSSQQSDIGPYPEPIVFSPHPHNLFLSDPF
jgi:hypothetical protein